MKPAPAPPKPTPAVDPTPKAVEPTPKAVEPTPAVDPIEPDPEKLVRAGKDIDFGQSAQMVFDSDATGSMGRARTGLGYDWHAWHIFVAMGPAALAYGLVRWIDNTGEREEWERNMKERKAAAGDGGVMDGFAARGLRNGSSNDGSSSGTPMEVDELRAKLDEIRAALPVLEEELKRREGEKATEKRDDSAADEPTNVTNVTKETAGDDASTSSPAPSPSPSGWLTGWSRGGKDKDSAAATPTPARPSDAEHEPAAEKTDEVRPAAPRPASSSSRFESFLERVRATYGRARDALARGGDRAKAPIKRGVDRAKGSIKRGVDRAKGSINSSVKRAKGSVERGVGRVRRVFAGAAARTAKARDAARGAVSDAAGGLRRARGELWDRLHGVSKRARGVTDGFVHRLRGVRFWPSAEARAERARLRAEARAKDKAERASRRARKDAVREARAKAKSDVRAERERAKTKAAATKAADREAAAKARAEAKAAAAAEKARAKAANAAEKATKARPKAKATEVDAKVDEKAGGDLESAASSSYLSSLRGAWVDFTGASSGVSASSSPLEDLLGWWRGKSGELVGEDGAGSSSDGGEDEGEGDDEPWGYGDGRDSYRSPRRPSGEAGSDESREAARLRRTVGGMGGWFRNIAKQAEEDGDEE